MWNWNIIIFFILLVPRGLILGNTTSPMDPEEYARSFDQILEGLEEIGLNLKALQDRSGSCAKSQPQLKALDASGTNSLLQVAQAKFAMLKERLGTNEKLIKCPKMIEIRGPQISARSACTPFEQNTVDANGKLKKVPMLNCAYKGQENVIVPMPDECGDGAPAPSTNSQHQHPVCTPFEQVIVLPTGKPGNVKLLNCLYPNQTNVIVPLPSEEKGSKNKKGSKDKKGSRNQGGYQGPENLHIENNLNVDLTVSGRKK